MFFRAIVCAPRRHLLSSDNALPVFTNVVRPTDSGVVRNRIRTPELGCTEAADCHATGGPGLRALTHGAVSRILSRSAFRMHRSDDPQDYSADVLCDRSR